ncbi:hypothetical protein AMK23_34415 [Streptomyces sp. CB02130]|uniref:hypothetical protein n=1 Tax=Streptomyces sp. CB02130 TaxID=1703934 RepID=UPI00093E6231|nr:hypothetical protein [Streptomyces sp. CB02130]OKJ19389.1 hypothetical protein AMK23_34415 [Streptomyces sp. CB02130]
MPNLPQQARLHVVDLTAADATGVSEFLEPRLREQMDSQYGTPAFKTAFALDGIVRSAASRMEYHCKALAEDSFFNSRERLNSLHAVQDAWNTLWQAVFPWREEDGYDTARWVHVEYIDPAAAEQGEEMKARVAAEIEAELQTKSQSR